MPDEAVSPQSGLYFGQFRGWSKKKSTDDSLDDKEKVTSKEESPKKEAPQEKREPTRESQIESEAITEPVQKVEEPPTPLIKPSSNGKRETPSLFRKKEENKEEEQPIYDTKEEHYTDEAVESVWREFGKKRIEAGAGDAEKLVLGRKLDNKEGNEIVLHLGSQLERTILAKIEQELVQFLRKSLHNDLIVLKKEVAEQEASQKLYTSQDKYDHMVYQNPALKTLKEKLGLDFEY
ncbi:MAG: hypothetical protein GY816_20585 [Cytophagales bacterium]|nr:hypothetical protein [Cytophagales bacterium]